MDTSGGPTNEELRFAVLAADTALFTVHDGELYVRLIAVDRPPHFVNMQGLPGSLIRPHETAEDAVRRQLWEKAHIDPQHVHIEQLYTFSKIDRDKRGRVVSVAYMALVPWEDLSEKEKQHTPEVFWQKMNKAKKLAYDHDEILEVALERLRTRVAYSTLMSKMMPHEFTLTELEHTYELVLHTKLDKRNFRKKILKLGIVTPLAHKRKQGASRPAQLYSFASKKVDTVAVL